MKRSHLVRTLLPLLLSVPAAAPAQDSGAGDDRPGQSSVHGVVTDHDARTPVDGALVSLVPLASEIRPPRPRITDADGRFAFDSVPGGRYLLEVGRLGYEGREDTLLVEPDTEVRLVVGLSVSPLAVEPLVVEVTKRWRSRDLEGFDARRARLHGTFMDRAEIESRFARRVSDLLLTVPNTQFLGGALRNLRSDMIRACPMPVFVDGVPVAGGIDDHVSPDMVEAIEVYTSLAMVPPQYGPSRCGVVLVWLRPAVPPEPDPRRGRNRLLRGAAALGAFLALVLLARG